jgi:hypothetical protein
MCTGRASIGACPPKTRSFARSSPGSALPPESSSSNNFQRFPKERYQTEVESWRHLQSQNIEFTMKRLREPIAGHVG